MRREFDLASVFALAPEEAVAALKAASARLLLPVDIDRYFRERADVLDPTSLVAGMRALLDAKGALGTDR